MPSGDEMSEQDWHNGFAKSFAVFLNGHAIASTTSHGERLVDDDFTLLFNAHDEPMEFTVSHDTAAVVELDTALPLGHDRKPKLPARGHVTVEARSMVVLRHES
jgi:isoamylase